MFLIRRTCSTSGHIFSKTYKSKQPNMCAGVTKGTFRRDFH